MTNNNDSPKWASQLSADVKASMAQAAEDRKQAAEDRKKSSEEMKAYAEQAEEDRKRMSEIMEQANKKAEEDRKQAAEDRKNFATVIKVVVESAVSGAAQVFSKELIEDRKQAAKDRQIIADKFDEVIRRLDKLIWHFNGHRNGNGGRGNPNGRRK